MATNGNKKTLFLSIFDPHSPIVYSVFDCRLPGLITGILVYSFEAKILTEVLLGTQILIAGINCKSFGDILNKYQYG